MSRIVRKLIWRPKRGRWELRSGIKAARRVAERNLRQRRVKAGSVGSLLSERYRRLRRRAVATRGSGHSSVIVATLVHPHSGRIVAGARPIHPCPVKICTTRAASNMNIEVTQLRGLGRFGRR